MIRDGHDLSGMNVVVYGTVPIGSGLSSSAAMEMASSLAFETASAFTLDPVKRALIEYGKDPAQRDLASCQQMVEASYESEDYKEGQAAFAEKRKPHFRGR